MTVDYGFCPPSNSEFEVVIGSLDEDSIILNSCWVPFQDMKGDFHEAVSSIIAIFKLEYYQFNFVSILLKFADIILKCLSIHHEMYLHT